LKTGIEKSIKALTDKGRESTVQKARLESVEKVLSLWEK